MLVQEHEPYVPDLKVWDLSAEVCVNVDHAALASKRVAQAVLLQAIIDVSRLGVFSKNASEMIRKKKIEDGWDAFMWLMGCTDAASLNTICDLADVDVKDLLAALPYIGVTSNIKFSHRKPIWKVS